MLSTVPSTQVRLLSESMIGASQLSFWDDNITQVANAQNKQIDNPAIYLSHIRLACYVDMHFAVSDYTYTLLYQHRTDSLISSGSFYLHLFSSHFSHNIPSSDTGSILICTVRLPKKG